MPSSFFQESTDLPGSLLLDETIDMDGNVNIQAVNWMSFMTFGIVSLVTAFYRSHSEGWECLSGSVVNCIISGNHLWFGQYGVTMTWSPIWLVFLRPVGQCSVVERHSLAPLATSSTHLPGCFLVWKVHPEVLGSFLCGSSLAIRSTTVYPTIWIACNKWSPLRPNAEPSCP